MITLYDILELIYIFYLIQDWNIVTINFKVNNKLML